MTSRGASPTKLSQMKASLSSCLEETSTDEQDLQAIISNAREAAAAYANAATGTTSTSNGFGNKSKGSKFVQVDLRTSSHLSAMERVEAVLKNEFSCTGFLGLDLVDGLGNPVQSDAKLRSAVKSKQTPFKVVPSESAQIKLNQYSEELQELRVKVAFWVFCFIGEAVQYIH